MEQSPVEELQLQGQKVLKQRPDKISPEKNLSEKLGKDKKQAKFIIEISP